MPPLGRVRLILGTVLQQGKWPLRVVKVKPGPDAFIQVGPFPGLIEMVVFILEGAP